MLYTVSAVQILAILDGWQELEAKRAGSKLAIAQCEEHVPRLAITS